MVNNLEIYGVPGQEHDSHSSQIWPLGTKMILPGGREFRFVENGAVAMAAGKLYQMEVVGGDFDELAVPAAAAVGDKTIQVTTGATAITANQFNEGYLLVEDDAGEGYLYPLTEHDAVGTTANGVMNLAPGYSVQVALTTSSTVLLIKNKFKDLIVHPSPNTAPIIGCAMAAVAANEYGWVQVKGLAPVLTDGTIVIGQHVRASDAVDGAVEALDRDGTAEDEQEVGVVASVSADAEYSLIDLTIE